MTRQARHATHWNRRGPHTRPPDPQSLVDGLTEAMSHVADGYSGSWLAIGAGFSVPADTTVTVVQAGERSFQVEGLESTTGEDGEKLLILVRTSNDHACPDCGANAIANYEGPLGANVSAWHAMCEEGHQWVAQLASRVVVDRSREDECCLRPADPRTFAILDELPAIDAPTGGGLAEAVSGDAVAVIAYLESWEADRLNEPLRPLTSADSLEAVTPLVVVGYRRRFGSDYPYGSPYPVLEMLGVAPTGDHVLVAMAPSMAAVFRMALYAGPVVCPIPNRAIRGLSDSPTDQLSEFEVVWPSAGTSSKP